MAFQRQLRRLRYCSGWGAVAQTSDSVDEGNSSSEVQSCACPVVSRASCNKSALFPGRSMSFCETVCFIELRPRMGLCAKPLRGRSPSSARSGASPTCAPTAGIPLRSGLARRFDAIPPQPTAHIPGSPRPGRSAWRVCERCRWSGAGLRSGKHAIDRPYLDR